MYKETKLDKHLLSIGYTSKMLEAQKQKTQDSLYLENLLYEELVSLVKSHYSRFDYLNMNEVVSQAIEEKDKPKKSERPNFEMLKDFLLEDFLDNDKKFKLVEIHCIGLPAYAYGFEVKGYDKTFQITIPYMKNIDSVNFEYANEGQYNLTIKMPGTGNSWLQLAHSYDAKYITQKIKEVTSMSIEDIMLTNRLE